MAYTGKIANFLVKLLAILVVGSQIITVSSICRYGDDSWCAFECFCTTQCNEDTGQCLNDGECFTISGIPEIKRRGAGCLIDNVARNKEAYQVGAWSGYDANRARDGNTNGNIDAGSCAHPDSGNVDVPAWWYVDLGKIHKIRSVTIYKRSGYDARFSDFTIRVGDSTDMSQNPVCATFGDPPTSGDNFSFSCERTGRYVGILRNSVSLNEKHLATFCEVVVMGYEPKDCTSCSSGGCDDLYGCQACNNGTKYPDCKRECSDDRWGQNCEETCPPYCKPGSACNKVSGICDEGCDDFTNTNVWRFGDYCDKELPHMSFGSSDTVDTSPVDIIDTSVSWRWKEGRIISSDVAQYVGYYLWYRKTTESTWSKTPGIPYRYGEEYQTGTVSGLQPGTRYEFDISVYRTYGGDVYENTNYRAATPGGPLDGKYLIAQTEVASTTTTTTVRTPTPASTPAPTPVPVPTQAPTPASTAAPTPDSTPTPASGVTPAPTPVTPDPPTPQPPTPSPEPTSGKSAQAQDGGGTNPGIIGGAVAAAVVLIAAAVLIVLFLLRRKGIILAGKGGKKTKLRDQEITIEGGAPMTGNGMTASNGFVNAAFEADSGNKLGEENIYVNTPPPSQPVNSIIAIQDLKGYVESRRNQHDGFKAEFSSIKTGELRECSVGNLPENKSKNRFGNIKAYDATRVILDIEDDGGQTDYINANYISGYKNKENVYVATQAPKPHTIQDLWRMIWQLDVNRIVMVTQIVETGRKKSEYYWSETIGAAQTHGEFSITMQSYETFTDYAVRIFNVTKGDETRTVRHFQFLLWPDKVAPEHSFPLLSFRRKVRSVDSLSTGPMVVHCSAGVGRTGTFIALDCLIQQAEQEGEVDIVTLVNRLRSERTTMIQTLPQYVFVYESLLEAITCGTTAIPCASLQSKLESLQTSEDGSSPIEEQYQILRTMIATRSGGSGPQKVNPKLDGLKEENLSKNRCNHIIPANNHRPCLSTRWDGCNDYINAVMVDSFKTSNAIIATQHPLENTIVDFWRLVYDHRCQTIIMLNQLDKNDELEPFQQCVEYWPTDEEPKEMYGPLEVKLDSTETTGTVVIRNFEVTNPNGRNDSPLLVRHFQLLEWPNDEKAPTTGSMLELVDKLSVWHANGNKGRIIAHCIDGASRSGLYCATNYMLEKMKNDNEVDVFLSVRYVALRRPEFVDSIEQYTFLHQLALEYMTRYDSEHTYANT